MPTELAPWVFHVVNETPFISGIGLITPLGDSAGQTWRALLNDEFVRDHARTSFASGVDRVNRMATAAANEAIAHARWTKEVVADPSTALVIGTSKGPIEKFLLAGEPCDFGLAELATSMARDLGVAGARCTTSAACASGLHALIHATLLLRSGAARRALVVAAEASVHPLFVGSFKRLGVLPSEGFGCRPFDVDRQGFLISEAAAAVTLETDVSDDHALARIDRIALAADATHLTGGDPDGRALRHLLGQVIENRPIDLIHAHATGTPFNDPIELAAIESELPGAGPAPAIYSHKGALGHSLGASGLLAVALNCMAHRNSIIPGNVQTRRPIDSKVVQINQRAIERPIRRSVAIAAGFGGAMAGLSLTSPKQ